MTDAPTLTAPHAIPPYDGSDTAPFIYFDIASPFGVLNGAVLVELGARVLVPRADGGVDTKLIATGHLRCSPLAAQSLRDALNGALKMLEQPQHEQIAASRLN